MRLADVGWGPTPLLLGVRVGERPVFRARNPKPLCSLCPLWQKIFFPQSAAIGRHPRAGWPDRFYNRACLSRIEKRTKSRWFP